MAVEQYDMMIIFIYNYDKKHFDLFRIMKYILQHVIFTILIISMGYGQSTYTYTQPKTLDDGWQTNTLRSQNIDTTMIYNMFSQLKKEKHKLHSVLVIKNNELVIEEYFDNHSVSVPHDLRSTTKSIRALLLGIAIDKGFIDDVNDPISKYLKNPVPTKNLDARKETITIKHLVTMSSGLECNDWDKKSKGQEDRVSKKKDWMQYTLNLPMVHEPGTVAAYCSMGAIMVAEIISRASGMPINEFADQYLFDPLGITNVQWGHTSNKSVISSGRRLYMTPRDMAKIGQLVLNKGKWNGEQLVSETWIEEATTPKTKITGIDYGYLWWNIPYKIKEKVIVSKTATGNGGQYIMVFPELDMITVFTGGAYNLQEDKLPFAIMNNIFLPIFTSEKQG